MLFAALKLLVISIFSASDLQKSFIVEAPNFMCPLIVQKKFLSNNNKSKMLKVFYQ